MNEESRASKALPVPLGQQVIADLPVPWDYPESRDRQGRRVSRVQLVPTGLWVPSAPGALQASVEGMAHQAARTWALQL